MRLLTLNTYSLQETDYEQKLAAFAAAASQEQPDIIALQEVNQTIAAQPAACLDGYVPCVPHAVVRQDNHVCRAAELLRAQGVAYDWTWLPMKIGHDIFDEGIALMSRSKILETAVVTVSAANDYTNWKTRKLVGIRTAAAPEEWFFSVHYGWWDDAEESFQAQWARTLAYLHAKNDTRVWLMGDFNSPAEVRGEGYDLVAAAGWKDSFLLAEKKDSGITVGTVIDGWREKLSDTDGMRIDHIWCNQNVQIASSQVIFNGRNRAVVSDHYGVIVDYERGMD